MRLRVACGVALAVCVSAPGAGVAAAPAPSRLLVTATEFRLALSRGSLPAGPATVQLSNRGQDAHDLVVRRLSRTGRQIGATPTAAPQARPGTVLERTYRLIPGRYVLFCSLPGHRRLGMRARLTVTR